MAALRHMNLFPLKISYFWRFSRGDFWAIIRRINVLNVTFAVPSLPKSCPGERTGHGADTVLRWTVIDTKWRGERRFFILQVIFMDFRENAILMPIEV